jgi:NhaA family Na+:H+ antiporter
MSKKGIYYAPWEKAIDGVLTPLEEFIHQETTSSILLMICAVTALVIANGPLHYIYDTLLHTSLSIGVGTYVYSLTFHHWINDALMAVFFLVMGLELKRELMVGELSCPNQALLPIMAAIGGMVIPALAYYLFNPTGSTVIGWGIPMATDIAFAIGALSLLGPRVPKTLITFLIALAIVDDLGAVAVIAIFYTDSIYLPALYIAGAFTAVLVSLNLAGIRHSLPFIIIGVMLWSAMLASGIHATIAGIIVAFTIPIRPKFEPQYFINRVKEVTLNMQKSIVENPDIIHNDQFRTLATSLGDEVHRVQAPAQRAEHYLHLPVAYLVIPIFALANTGIPIDVSGLRESLGHPITLGVMAGLLLGKPIGILGFTWIVVKMGWAELPTELNMKHILGVGLLGGVGFTMSIFIAGLGFVSLPEDLLLAKTGIVLASLLAGVSGFCWLKYCIRDQTNT